MREHVTLTGRPPCWRAARARRRLRASLGGAMVVIVAAVIIVGVGDRPAPRRLVPRSVSFDRAGPPTTRLGEPADVTLDRAQHRYANPPRSGARCLAALGRRHAPRLASRGRARRDQPADLHPGADPSRGALGRRRDDPGPRSAGARGPPAHPASAVDRSGPAGVHQPTTAAGQAGAVARARRPVAAHVRGQGSEFDSLREYVDGDDVRSIDWRATARRDEVVVRTWRPERDRQVMIVLDTGRTAAGRVGDAPRFDASLDAALLLAALANRAGDRVELLGSRPALRAGVGHVPAGDVLPALDACRRLEPELVETDVTAIVAQLLRRLRRRSLIVLLHRAGACRDRGRPAAGMPVAGQPPHGARGVGRRTRASTSCATSRDDAGDAYGAAAAETARTERARAVATLRRSGVIVVVCPARQVRLDGGRRLPRAQSRRPPLSVGSPPTGETSPRAASSRSPVSPASTARRPSIQTYAEEHRLRDHADPDPRPRRQPRRRDERLDHAGDGEHADQPDGDRDRRAALLGERVGPASRSRVDDGPAEPQPGPARDEHGGQLEQPVRRISPKNRSALPAAAI